MPVCTGLPLRASILTVLCSIYCITQTKWHACLISHTQLPVQTGLQACTVICVYSWLICLSLGKRMILKATRGSCQVHGPSAAVTAVNLVAAGLQRAASNAHRTRSSMMKLCAQQRPQCTPAWQSSSTAAESPRRACARMSPNTFLTAVGRACPDTALYLNHMCREEGQAQA